MTRPPDSNSSKSKILLNELFFKEKAISSLCLDDVSDLYATLAFLQPFFLDSRHFPKAAQVLYRICQLHLPELSEQSSHAVIEFVSRAIGMVGDPDYLCKTLELLINDTNLNSAEVKMVLNRLLDALNLVSSPSEKCILLRSIHRIVSSKTLSLSNIFIQRLLNPLKQEKDPACIDAFFDLVPLLLRLDDRSSNEVCCGEVNEECMCQSQITSSVTTSTAQMLLDFCFKYFPIKFKGEINPGTTKMASTLKDKFEDLLLNHFESNLVTTKLIHVIRHSGHGRLEACHLLTRFQVSLIDPGLVYDLLNLLVEVGQGDDGKALVQPVLELIGYLPLIPHQQTVAEQCLASLDPESSGAIGLPVMAPLVFGALSSEVSVACLARLSHYLDQCLVIHRSLLITMATIIQQAHRQSLIDQTLITTIFNRTKFMLHTMTLNSFDQRIVIRLIFALTLVSADKEAFLIEIMQLLTTFQFFDIAVHEDLIHVFQSIGQNINRINSFLDEFVISNALDRPILMQLAVHNEHIWSLLTQINLTPRFALQLALIGPDSKQGYQFTLHTLTMVTEDMLNEIDASMFIDRVSMLPALIRLVIERHIPRLLNDQQHQALDNDVHPLVKRWVHFCSNAPQTHQNDPLLYASDLNKQRLVESTFELLNFHNALTVKALAIKCDSRAIEAFLNESFTIDDPYFETLLLSTSLPFSATFGHHIEAEDCKPWLIDKLLKEATNFSVHTSLKLFKILDSMPLDIFKLHDKKILSLMRDEISSSATLTYLVPRMIKCIASVSGHLLTPAIIKASLFGRPMSENDPRTRYAIFDCFNMLIIKKCFMDCSEEEIESLWEIIKQGMEDKKAIVRLVAYRCNQSMNSIDYSSQALMMDDDDHVCNSEHEKEQVFSDVDDESTLSTSSSVYYETFVEEDN